MEGAGLSIIRFRCWEKGGAENDTKIFLETLDDMNYQDLECEGYSGFEVEGYKQILHCAFGEFPSVDLVGTQFYKCVYKIYSNIFTCM